MRPPCFIIAAVASMLGGCQSVSTDTALSADGSFTRHMVYEVLANQGQGLNLGTNKPKPRQHDFADEFKVFRIPSPAPGVTVRRVPGDTKDQIIVDSKAAADSKHPEGITLLKRDGSVLLASTVTVRRLDGNRLEYEEVLHWAGTPLTIADWPPLRDQVKKALPERLRNTETIDRVSAAVLPGYVHALFGPPTPQIMNLFQGSVGVRAIHRAAYPGLLAALDGTLPGATEEERKTLARTLLDADNPLNPMEQLEKQEPNGPGMSEEAAGVSLSFGVTALGKIVETNGLIDPVTGGPYWDLMGISAAVGDVKLHLIVQL